MEGTTMTLTLAAIDPTDEPLLQKPGVWEVIPAGIDVVSTSSGYQFLTYEGCAALLRHPGLNTGFRVMYESVGVTDEAIIRGAELSVNGAEGPDHMRQRTAIGSFFTPARTESFREEVSQMIDGLLADAELKGDFDIVNEVLRHIPARFFAILLGVSQDNSDFIRYISESIVKVFSMDQEGRDQVEKAKRDQAAWAERVVAETDHGDHLVGHLLRQQDGGNLSEAEVRNAIRTLLAASVDTTQRLMTEIVSAFADNLDQFERVRQDHSLVPSAVIETARWAPPGPILRVSMEDVDIDGVQIPKGSLAWAVVFAGNRDPSLFEDADTFDVARVPARQPLNWGVGRHFCLGRMMAVMECEELVRRMAIRWNEIRRAPGQASESAASADAGQALWVTPVPA
jgi:cytochrome P450